MAAKWELNVWRRHVLLMQSAGADQDNQIEYVLAMPVGKIDSHFALPLLRKYSSCERNKQKVLHRKRSIRPRKKS